jgi:hypothetical protein
VFRREIDPVRRRVHAGSANGDVLTCKVNYQPSRKLSVGTYQNYLTATMGASGDYKTASGHANLVVQTK